MDSTSAVMRSLFLRYVTAHAPKGAVGAVADLLTDDALTREAFDEIVGLHGVSTSPSFRDDLLDLILYCVRDALRDHCLTTDELELIRRLTLTFRVNEGEFYSRRRTEVADLLQQEMQRILEDVRVDAFEASYLEALQRIFGLGYDQYLELTRAVLTPFVDRAIAKVSADGVVTRDERAEIDRRIAALRTVYHFSPIQRRALGLARAEDAP